MLNSRRLRRFLDPSNLPSVVTVRCVAKSSKPVARDESLASSTLSVFETITLRSERKSSHLMYHCIIDSAALLTIVEISVPAQQV